MVPLRPDLVAAAAWAGCVAWAAGAAAAVVGLGAAAGGLVGAVCVAVDDVQAASKLLPTADAPTLRTAIRRMKPRRSIRSGVSVGSVIGVAPPSYMRDSSLRHLRALVTRVCG